MINVTKAYLPPFDEYHAYLKEIWENGWLTNNGNCVVRLEKELRDYLGVKYLQCVSNGTLALQIAIRALDLKGEIITTPFSYVATTDSIIWENCTPVFADIEPDTLTISPRAIEKAITKKTSAILATHVYGNPCDVESIAKIARKHKLKVIYDAAHCFGVKYKNKSVLEYGDISVLSFHATKLFHTVEGGAIVCNSKKLDHICSYLRNFGHKGYEGFWGVGINAKVSELHAAMGLCNLPKVDGILEARKQASDKYINELSTLKSIRFVKIRDKTTYNFSYFPIIFENEKALLKVMAALKNKNVIPRRYFYPSLNKVNFVRYKRMPVSEDISARVLCLPLYYGISDKEIKYVCDIIKQSIDQR